jgi:hypothetical protein
MVFHQALSPINEKVIKGTVQPFWMMVFKAHWNLKTLRSLILNYAELIFLVSFFQLKGL